MRIAGGLFSLLICLTSGAQAQVSVDMKALDSLGPAQPSGHAPPLVKRPAPAAAPGPGPTAHTAAPSSKAPGDGAPPSGTAATAPDHAASRLVRPAVPATGGSPVASVPVGNASTAGAAIPALPTQQPAAPPPSTMIAAPAPSPVPLPPPVRVVFAEGKTDLSPADEAAIRDLARAIPTSAADSVNVVAYAAGKPDDPSTARRLSLSRGIAVRSVLLASGVPSAQIYVRALGASAPDAPADRVELTVAPIGTVTR